LALFLAAQFFFHPQGLIASLGALIIFSLILLIKTRKIPFNLKHLTIAFVLFAFVCVIFAPFNVGAFFSELTTPQSAGAVKNFQFDKLFKWYQGIKNDPGLPDFYFTYNMAHGSLQDTLLSWWTLPFLLIGLLVLFYRRKDEDLVLISWFISFYFLTRLVVFGYGTRDLRMFAYEAHVFYPIIAIGLISISSFSRHEAIKKYLKFGLIILFFILAVFINGKSAYNVLKSQQNSIGRINVAQYEAAEWIRANLPIDADIYDIGTLGFQNFAAKIKWLGVLSQRHFIVDKPEINLTDYVLLDYTDALSLRDQNYINFLQDFQLRFQNSTAIYDKNNIKVYQIAGIKI